MSVVWGFGFQTGSLQSNSLKAVFYNKGWGVFKWGFRIPSLHETKKQVWCKFYFGGNLQTCPCLQVVEGATRLPLDSTGCRKRLRSAEEEEEEQKARRTWELRPNPEGSLSAGELSSYGKTEDDEEKLQRLCQRCQVMATQLNRQAAALTDTAALQVRNNGVVLRCDKGFSLVKYL